MYFGRVHPRQLIPLYDAGWDKVLSPDATAATANSRVHDPTPEEWEFLHSLFERNDFCGLILYPDLLNEKALQQFFKRFGPPICEAQATPTGRMVFIPKNPAWRERLDRVKGREAAVVPRYQPGERIAFAGPHADRFLYSGWNGAAPGEDFRWTEGSRALMRFRLDEPIPLRLRMLAATFGRQRLILKLNSAVIGSWTGEGGPFQLFELDIPQEVVRQRNALEFDLPDATSPMAHGHDDSRTLGARVAWLELVSLAPSPYEPGTRMDFAKPSPYEGDGWYAPEAHGRWSGPEASLRFALNTIQPLELQLFAETYGLQPIVISLNGRDVGTLHGDGGPARVYKVAIPPEFQQNKNVMTFKLPNAQSPKSRGEGTDERALGVRVQWIALVPKT
jgi:hypothetical protein